MLEHLWPLIANVTECFANRTHTIIAVEEENVILFYREERDNDSDDIVVLGPFSDISRTMFGVHLI